jgi:hypothetical protein
LPGKVFGNALLFVKVELIITMMNIAVICGTLVLGIFLIVWAVYHDAKKLQQGLQSIFLFKQLERLGHLLVYISLFFPVAHGIALQPYTTRLWLSFLLLVVGLLFMALAITDICLKVTKKLLVLLLRTSLTSLINSIAGGVTFFLLEVGAFLMVTGFGLLMFIISGIMKS